VRLPLLLLSALLIPLVAVPSAEAAVDICRYGISGNRVCTEVEGLCARAWYVPPFTDFFAGAGECPTVAAGPQGASACLDAHAGYATLAGFFGYAGWTCGAYYEDAYGRACVSVDGENNLADINTKPVCR